MTLGLLALLAIASLDAKADVRVVVAIGNNLGVGSDEPLDYAEEDAKKFVDLMVEIGGVSRDRTYLVTGGDAAEIRATLYEVRGRIRELAMKMRTVLIVFVSGHADQDALHLDGSTLPVAELRDLVGTTDADLRLTVIDACQTAASTKLKGGRPSADVEVSFVRPARTSGDILIRSASPGEPAQERAFLRGALFSHHLLAGLRGAADRDRDTQISLTEAYTYAYSRTAAEATLGGAPQHPSFDFDVEGAGAWILTRPGVNPSSLTVGGDIEGTVWIANRKRELVAEVAKLRGERIRLALPPGRYRVVRPVGTEADVADVNVGWNSAEELNNRDFVRVRLKNSVLRGTAPIELRPWQVSVGYAIGMNPLPGDATEHLALLRLRRSFGHWQGRLQLAATTDQFDAVNGSTRNRVLGIGLAGTHTVPLSWLDLGIGVEVNLDRVWQTFERDDADVTEPLFGIGSAERAEWLVGAAVLSYIAVPLTDQFWLQTEVGVGGTRVPLENATETQILLRGTILLGWSY